MSLPETDAAQVRRLVEARSVEIGDLIDEVDGGARAIAIPECRQPGREDSGPGWTSTLTQPSTTRMLTLGWDARAADEWTVDDLLTYITTWKEES